MPSVQPPRDVPDRRSTAQPMPARDRRLTAVRRVALPVICAVAPGTVVATTVPGASAGSRSRHRASRPSPASPTTTAPASTPTATPVPNPSTSSVPTAAAPSASATGQPCPSSGQLADIDLFKKINNEYGHRISDQVISAVAGRLRAALRASDLLGRYGGEEFTALIGYPVPDPDVVGERLRRAVCDGTGRLSSGCRPWHG